jgi:hypothetical protein
MTFSPWFGLRDALIAAFIFEHSIGFPFDSLPFLLLDFLPGFNFLPFSGQNGSMSARLGSPIDRTGQRNHHRNKDNSAFHDKISPDEYRRD